MNSLLYPLKRIILSFILFTLLAGEGSGCGCGNQSNDSGQENSSGGQSGPSSGGKNGQKSGNQNSTASPISTNFQVGSPSEQGTLSSQIETPSQQPVVQVATLTGSKNSSASNSRTSGTLLFPSASSSQIRPLTLGQQPVTQVATSTGSKNPSTCNSYTPIFDVKPDDNMDLINWVAEVRSGERKVPFNLSQQTDYELSMRFLEISYELFMQILINDIEIVIRNHGVRDINDEFLNSYKILFIELNKKFLINKFNDMKAKYKIYYKTSRREELIYNIVPIISMISIHKMDEAKFYIKNLGKCVYDFLNPDIFEIQYSE